MSDESTKKMLSAYVQNSDEVPGFFTSFMRSPPENYFKSATVEIDIRRNGNQIAPVIYSLAAGMHRSSIGKEVNKEFTPAIYGEEFSIDVQKLNQRAFGQDPFQEVNYLTALQTRFFSEMNPRRQMISRGIELQCAQMFQTGVLSLPGADGTTAFALDYKPKATHFPGASTDWDATPAAGSRMADVRSLCEVVHVDGGLIPANVVFGKLACDSWLGDADVQKQVEATGNGLGKVVPPEFLRAGGVYKGRVVVGNYALDMWTYPGHYTSLTTGLQVTYMSDWNVTVLPEQGRYDLVFGDIVRVVPPDPRLDALAIGRVASDRLDLITNAWVDPRGTTIMGSVAARPLAIPTAIDTYGTLNAKVT